MLELYQNIRRLRRERDMSQEELARLTGYGSRSSIAKIERGDVDIPQSKIVLFAKALHVSPQELMGDSKEMSFQLKPEEIALLEMFHRLNDVGKERLLEQLDLMLTSEKFTISNHEKKEENFA